MSKQPTSQYNQRQKYNELHDEVADILLGPDSPVRGATEFGELIAEHDRSQSRQAELQALDAKLVEVVPGLEHAEAQLAAAEKQLAAEKKTLAGFAGELGKAAFVGLRTGELPDNPLFADRKDLQSRIDTLQRQKAELVAGENAGMMEKAKIQAQQLKLTGQVKVEELKIGSTDRALGTALLTSKEKPAIRCGQTDDVLKTIEVQRKQVAIVKEKAKQAETAVAGQRSAAAATLGRSTVHDAASLKSELKEVRKEHRENEKKITSIRSSVVATALETKSLREEAIVGEKLKQLWSLKFDLEANKTQGMKMLDESVSRFRGLPPKIKYGAYGVAGVVVLLMAISFLGGDGNVSKVASTDSGDQKTKESTGRRTQDGVQPPGGTVKPRVASKANDQAKSSNQSSTKADDLTWVVDLVTSANSSTYSQGGFKVFNFGDSRAEVEDALADHPVSPGEDGHHFIFDNNDKLVGYWQRYRKDNDKYISLVRDLFGDAAKERITSTDSVQDSGIDGTDILRGRSPSSARRVIRTSHSILARYYFHQTIASSYVEWSKDSRSTRANETLTINLWDRQWIDAQLREHAEACHRVLTWVKSEVTAGHSDVDLKIDVKYIGTESVYESDEMSESVSLMTPKSGLRDSGKGKFITVYRRLKKSWQFPDEDEGVIRYEINLDNIPRFEDELQAKTGWTITIEKDRCSSLIAQSIFPPIGKTITIKRQHDSHMKSYSWRTKDGWNVVVGPGNRIGLNNIPKGNL